MKADEIAGRRDRVRSAILEHKSVRAVAKNLKVPPSTVHRDIKAIRREWQAARLEASEQVAAEDLQRLIDAERAIWPAVMKGELQAIDRLLKIMERRAKMLGIDAPDRIEWFLRDEAKRLAESLGLDEADVLADAERILAGHS